MPISPKEASERNLKSIESDLVKAFERIDKSLCAQYYGDNLVIVSFNDMNNRIPDEIVKAYESIGWLVKYESSSHRNEVCNVFKFQKKPKGPYKSTDPRGI